jgi:6-phospho-beta-glucosidase
MEPTLMLLGHAAGSAAAQAAQRDVCVQDVDVDALQGPRRDAGQVLTGAAPVKLAVVGAGSTYTPELVDGLVRMQDLLPVEELALLDVDRGRLDILAGMTRRMLTRGAHPARVTPTTRLEDAVEGADAVLIQLRVGGQAVRIVDESVPVACGCLGQETTGYGGLAKALRTVPVVLGIAERVRELAPRAWIVDFTNPVGIVTRALLDEGHRAVGLCSAARVFQRHFAKVLDVAPDLVELDHVGLNHLTWELGVRVDGEDVLPRLVGEHVDRVAPATGLPPDLVRRLGVVPSYYLHYFYEHDEVVEHQRHHQSRAEEVADIERRLLELYADESVDEKPELLGRRGGAFYSEAAVELMASLFGRNPNRRHVVNLRNRGTLPFLADDAVVEVPANVESEAVTPMPVPEPDPVERGLVAHVSAYEELALDAALRGGRERVFRALLAHPLVGQVDVAEKLTDRMIEANREFLSWAQ